MVTWRIVFTKQAQKDAKKLSSAGLQPKAQRLLEVLSENPFLTPPTYEKLVGDLAGAYSRRINIKHRLVYQVIEEIKTTDLSNIDAILSVSPYYSKPTQEGIYQHFKAISQASSIDIILYNVPGRTSKNIEPETTLRLANDFENIIAVKEAGNKVAQYLQLIKNKPNDFLVISGDDDLALGIALAGGSGVISVIGQAFPKEFSEMVRLGIQGNAKEAYKFHFRLMDVTNYIFEENNPAGIKAVLQSLGFCGDNVRLPLVPATQQLKDKISTFIERF